MWLLAASAVLFWSACGPPELPGFANPPKPDAGADTEDAGASDASRD